MKLLGCYATGVVAVAAILGSPAGAQPPTDPAEFEQRSSDALIQERIESLQARLKALRDAQARTAARLPADAAGLKVVNGVLTGRHPTAGALLKVRTGSTLTGWCSGTLIGLRTFLTAQHCVDDDQNAGNYRVFLQHAGFFRVTAIYRHADYDFPTNDIAVLTLATDVTGIRPMDLRTETVSSGTRGLIVGFGRSGGDRDDYGLKRAGAVVTGSCESDFPADKFICWDFDDPLGLPGEDSNTCNGDSGGPLYTARAGGGFAIAGVTSGGRVRSCLQGDHSYDIAVPAYRDWIVTTGGDDVRLRNWGTGPFALEPRSRVALGADRLSEAVPEKKLLFRVLRTARAARVSVHGHDDDTTDFGWSVTFKPSSGGPARTCRPDTGQWGYCEFDRPGAGTIEVKATRRAGEGQFQAVVTEFD